MPNDTDTRADDVSASPYVQMVEALFEPAVQCLRDNKSAPAELTPLASIAISLKRIADATECEVVTGEPFDNITVRAGGPLDDGWIDWRGAKCPVPPETMVEVKLRDGASHTAKARAIHWGRNVFITELSETMPAEYEVIAYRVVAK